jgi:hypothetical protein
MLCLLLQKLILRVELLELPLLQAAFSQLNNQVSKMFMAEAALMHNSILPLLKALLQLLLIL